MLARPRMVRAQRMWSSSISSSWGKAFLSPPLLPLSCQGSLGASQEQQKWGNLDSVGPKELGSMAARDQQCPFPSQHP